MHFLVLVFCLVAAPKPVEVADPGATSSPTHEHVDISVLPVVGYGADDGTGGGVLGGIYWRQPGLLPYKYGLEALVYITDRQVYADGIYFDWVHVNDLPLRLTVGGFFWATLDDTYCGFGNNVTCSVAVANHAADELQLRGNSRNNFISTYYYRRYLNPSGEAKLLWQLGSEDPKIEINLSYRGSGYIPGVFGDLRPYPKNYYATAFPNGEPGFASVFQLGIFFDDRDQEGSPTEGYWFDASVRGSHHAWGSTWDYAGLNATARTYLPLLRSHTLTWANRFIADFIFGTPSVAEFSEIGCYSLVPGGLQGFGGPDVGRGIRQNRYLGRIRIMDQTEVRWLFSSFDVFDQRIDLTVLGYVDSAWVGLDYDNFGGDPRKIIVSEGVGLRLIWDKDFIVRLDVGVSAVENYAMDAYLNLNQVF